MIAGNALVEQPEIIDAFAPSFTFSQEAQIIGCFCRPSVPAMIVGIDGIALLIQGLCEGRITCAVLRQPVNNLDRGLGWSRRQPPIYKKFQAVISGQNEIGSS